MKRKIIAVTGARSDYDLLFKVYERLNTDEQFDFSLIVTGPHLSDNFGLTVKQVEADGFEIAGKVYNLVDSNEKIGRIVSIGYQIPNLAHIFINERPDIVLVAGDREEAITVTMTCAYMDIPVAHFFGGDIAKDGNIDNSTRYAASKFAHIHFPTLPEHKTTLLKLGEDEWRIFVVGNPALDRLVNLPEMSRTDATMKVSNGKDISDYCVLIQHPIITQVEQQDEHIRTTLDAILETDQYCFINYPNSDAGNAAIISAYKEYTLRYPQRFTLFQNLDRITYINLLRHARYLVGNSSSGLVEVASLGLPAINIGERQRDRLCGDNVVFVGNNKDDITAAISFVLNDEAFREKVALKINPYGDGKSTEKIVSVLAKIELDKKLIYKNITY
ncbi:UDP-N-acetylglucosamine 2-epimerase [Taibaiella koreensis]|uniref:UDP-N-acetylglucosamine 2-epimerase n=1 Tax=Taibaiella koreensis TaxID=1268548 RepID=UPI000E59D996|nr:UDP-N-acetylglucosamine 2-epimerase [Taibaiella koreensis]